ncbi:hypothetical protein [Mucilaginibacter hurinus]|nr:hypothetical protein [Mucilaginibacter hurinus]
MQLILNDVPDTILPVSPDLNTHIDSADFSTEIIVPPSPIKKTG